MKFTRERKKGFGIALLVIFLPIQLLFLASLLYILLTGDEATVETSIAFIFTMGLFFVPLWYGFRLWKEGTSKPSTPFQHGATDTRSKVKIHTKIELPEYRRVIFSLTYRTPLFIFIHFLAASFLIFYLSIGIGDWFVIFLFIFIFYLPIGIFRSANSNYLSTKVLHEPVTYEFSYDKFTIAGETFNSTFQWRSLYKVTELKSWFLLYTSKQMAMLIPKKAFSAAEDIEEFRAMAHQTHSST